MRRLKKGNFARKRVGFSASFFHGDADIGNRAAKIDIDAPHIAVFKLDAVLQIRGIDIAKRCAGGNAVLCEQFPRLLLPDAKRCDFRIP